MKICVLISVLACAAVAYGELLMKVRPELVHPGVTPTFSVNCALEDPDEGKIVSLTISRRTGGQSNIHTAPAEKLVSLSAMAPSSPVILATYPGIVSHGHITAFETELGSHLQLIWPVPDVEDLGIYTCEAVVIGAETGGLVTLQAHAHVSSGEPVLDRVLVILARLDGTIQGFNMTLQDLQKQVDAISAVQQERLQKESILEGLVDVSGDDAFVVTTAASVEDPVTMATDDATTAKPKPKALPVLDRVVSSLDSLTGRMDQFNATISSMEAQITKLAEAASAQQGLNQLSFSHHQNSSSLTP